MLTWMFNSAWQMACRPEAIRFDAATSSIRDTQKNILLDIVQRNSQTEFGKRYRFSTIDTVQQYQTCVPLSCHADYEKDISKISAGKKEILTEETVDLLEPTSGSTGGEKLIPMTRRLRCDFQRAISPWLYDLLKNRPQLRHGRSYWSVSPAMMGERVTCGRIRIGFDDDAEYLSWPQEKILRHLLAVPPGVSQIQELQHFRIATLRYLLAADDLTLISVWSPTFLIALVQTLQENTDDILADTHIIPRRRLKQIRCILGGQLPWFEKLQRIWPRLNLISCWADGAATRYIPDLRVHFPQVEIQPKGLLATEGCVSFPLLGHDGAALAVRSHFFEFQEVDSGAIYLADELNAGKHYYVILTTNGGLYRYQLRDEIEVCGHFRQCPLLRFIGKADGICDMVGEKLAEAHCRSIIDRILEEHQIQNSFAMIVPLYQQRHYCLYIQHEKLVRDANLRDHICQRVESGLKQNPYYAHAVLFKQLAPLTLSVFHPDAHGGYHLYEQACLRRGIRLGNIKPAMMDKWDGWPAVFDGHCLL